MGDLITYEPKPTEFGYTFATREPVLSIRAGDVVQVFTEDCFGGMVRTVDDLPSQVCTAPFNPVSGPFWVQDAEPGDTLAVHLQSITPARPWGVSATFPHYGALTSTSVSPSLQPPLVEQVWWYAIDAEAGEVRFQARASDHVMALPLEPMLGTVGVAPGGGEALTTITSGLHGGNMDTRELRAGRTLYLPVSVDGALLALGDGHARQGEGEASGVAVETATWTTFTIEVIKGAVTPTPRLETDDAILSLGAARPLDAAYQISQHDLVGWVADLTGLRELDAYQLVAQAGTARVGNVCNPAFTMLGGIRKQYLWGATAYGGVHERLRAIPHSTPAGTGAP